MFLRFVEAQKKMYQKRSQIIMVKFDKQAFINSTNHTKTTIIYEKKKYYS